MALAHAPLVAYPQASLSLSRGSFSFFLLKEDAA
jgi:hypothetical protein